MVFFLSPKEQAGGTIVRILNIYIHVIPGMQEDAAKKFDNIFGPKSERNSDANVSKMLAKSGGVDSEPSGSRTQDHMIKSQVLRLN